MIRIGICEDNLQELQRQRKMVQNIMINLSKNIDPYCFQSGEDLLFEIDATGNMDIILMDIELLGINGVETARAIRKKDSRAILIFISAYDQYCKEMIEVQPFAFIDKPFSEEKLEQTLKHALETRFDRNEDYCFSFHKKQYNIPLAQIRSFQSDKRIIRLDTLHKSTLAEEYMFYGKMEDVERTVNKKGVNFIRIRKSFLVNPQFITEYSADKVVLDNGTVVEISRNYKNSVKECYASLLREKCEKSGHYSH